MQYIKRTNDDLKSGFSTYVLQNSGRKIDFFAYTGDTAINADERGQSINAHHRGYFLRKGFSDAIREADPNVIEPIYKDNNNKEVHPLSVDVALQLIYENKLNITGFAFKEGVTQEQKDEAFGNVINSFVSASRNLDFSSEKNLFIVQGNCSEVIYNNGGSQKMKIDGADVQEKIGLKTPDVFMKQAFRKKMQSMMSIHK